MVDLVQSDLMTLIGGGSKKKSKFRDECIRLYHIFTKENARGSQEHIPKELRDSLDEPAYR